MSRWAARRWTPVLLGAALITAVVAVPPNAVASAAGAVGDPTTLVDPFVGTGSGGQNVGQVDMFPGAATPFGMVSLSPETPRAPTNGSPSKKAGENR